MRYTIYDYIDYNDGSFIPSDEEVLPSRVNPKKDLIMRPYQEIFITEKGDVPTVIYWDSPDKNVPLMREEISYVRDMDGDKTKGLAITQTKVLKWYLHDDENDTFIIDENPDNSKILLKNYEKGSVKDSRGNKLPTASQMSEWGKKSRNVISYMLTKEVAGSPIDQAVFVLFDNIMFAIQRWQNNPVSTAFTDAINSKMGGFEIPISQTETMNIWDINVSSNPDNPYSLQTFLLFRLASLLE